MNLVSGAARAVTGVGEAATAALGAIGAATVGGLVGSLKGAAAGAAGAHRGSHSTPAAVLTMDAVAATGVVQWPIAAAVGGTALVLDQLKSGTSGQQKPGNGTTSSVGASPATSAAPKRRTAAKPASKHRTAAKPPSRPTPDSNAQAARSVASSGQRTVVAEAEQHAHIPRLRRRGRSIESGEFGGSGSADIEVHLFGNPVPNRLVRSHAITSFPRSTQVPVRCGMHINQFGCQSP
ncbi:hypothetical protein P3H15_48350 [Rhodococcus sp. T2V]|uniref:hypothetical protein n=1 Tax=Rhodococcus sp. T2V TaxID=3034164 RepID=UPI0023E2CE3D|nr:hypothetical protein [Rhodococcus sp. T2V]MDF3312755.1 hypothetical protein [Rhodococcus sp. T2V]